MDGKSATKSVSRLRLEKSRPAIRAVRRGLGRAAPPVGLALVHELEAHQADLKAQNAELRHTQDHLERSRHRLADFFDVAPVGYFRLDRRGLVGEVNLTAARLLGRDRRLLRNLPLIGFLVEEDRADFREYWRKLWQGRKPQTVEVRLTRADGSVVHAELQSSVTEDRADECCIAVLDITERKQVEKVRREFQAQLERAVQERTAKLQEVVAELEHFSYTLTHDLRAPLRSMAAFSNVLIQKCSEKLERRERELLGLIAAAAQRMDQLVTDALDYTKALGQEMVLAPLDAHALLREIVATYPNIHAAHARVQIQGAMPPVLANRAALTQCFSNLLGNAVRFVAPGTTPKVRVWAEDRGPRVRLWFEDNGIGVPKDLHQRIFQMFQRASHAPEGTGIGLALVRKVAERMGGEVGVESELGEGSRFWLELKRGNPNE
jgi:PAS domain S-box-containing protein